MNSLIRRIQNKNDISKIYAILQNCYQAGVADEELGITLDAPAYINGRVRDLVEVLGLKFDDKGNIDWHKIMNTKELYARA